MKMSFKSTKLPFKSKFMFIILPLVIVGLLSLTAVVYVKFQNIMKTELTNSMSLRTTEATDHINTWLTSRLVEVRETALNPMVKRILEINPNLNLKSDDKSVKLIDELNLSRWNSINTTYPDEYAALHIVNFLQPDEWSDPNNLNKLEARYFNVKDGKFKTSPWAKAATKEAAERYSKTGGIPYDAIFSPTYSESYARNVVLMFAWQKNNEGKVVAGAASSVTIETIQQKVKNLKYGQKGYAMLLAKDGTFIVHPNTDWEMKEKVDTVNDSDLNKLNELIATKQPGMFRFGKDSEKKIAFYAQAPIAEWTVVNVVYESELFAAGDKLLIIMSIIAIVGIIILSVAI